jgi:hypothetical protein
MGVYDSLTGGNLFVWSPLTNCEERQQRRSGPKSFAISRVHVAGRITSRGNAVRHAGDHDHGDDAGDRGGARIGLGHHRHRAERRRLPDHGQGDPLRPARRPARKAVFVWVKTSQDGGTTWDGNATSSDAAITLDSPHPFATRRGDPVPGHHA